MEVSVASAKNTLPQLIHQSEQGAHIQITRRGKPVAVLISLQEYHLLKQHQQRSFADAWAAFQSRYADIPLDAVDLDGLRSSDTGRDIEISA